MVSLIDHENVLSQGLCYSFILHFFFVSQNTYLDSWKGLRTSKNDFLAYLVVDSMAFRPRGTQTGRKLL